MRLSWIDTTKAICMLCVFWAHSQHFCNWTGDDYSYIIKPFYVNAFFFVSGYLFFKKHFNTSVSVKICKPGGGKP